MTEETIIETFGGTFATIAFAWLKYGRKRLRSWNVAKAFRRRLATEAWRVSSAGVRVVPGGKTIAFDTPGSASLVAPHHAGFEVRGCVKIARLVDNSGGPYPDFRIYLSTNPDGYPMLFTIFPWENSEKQPSWFECHVTESQGPGVGCEARLRQVPVCPCIQLPFSFEFTLSFQPSHGLSFQTTLDGNSPLFVPTKDISASGYPLELPQYLRFSLHNSAGKVIINNFRTLV
jgi:hypothetical protein